MNKSNNEQMDIYIWQNKEICVKIMINGKELKIAETLLIILI